MTGRAAGITRYICVAFAILIAASMPANAHHQLPHDGGPIGIVIPAIPHGEMLVLAKYRARILEIAARQVPADPTLRRLLGFVSLQHFACFWGLFPGSLSDETSPFNECSHAYLAGTRALLEHLVTMPGDQSSAKVLQASIAEELASDPTFAALCVNSSEAFDSGIIVGPDWQLAATHLPTLITFSLFAVALAGLVCSALALSRRRSSVRSDPA